LEGGVLDDVFELPELLLPEEVESELEPSESAMSGFFSGPLSLLPELSALLLFGRSLSSSRSFEREGFGSRELLDWLDLELLEFELRELELLLSLPLWPNRLPLRRLFGAGSAGFSSPRWLPQP